MNIQSIDYKLINFFHKISGPISRIALFVVFFWFGVLKLTGHSPAGPLVESLFENTVALMIPILPFVTFMTLFALFECLIGLLFLVPRAERVVLPLLFIHFVMTVLPLFLLPEVTWSGFLAPTLEGQYIIKNLLIVAVGISIAANLEPLRRRA